MSQIEFVHEGWDHLQRQRPLAAWASWRRALGQDPGLSAAAQAVAKLESAADLPVAARRAYSLRQPADPSRRAAWDVRLGARGGEGQDLALMVEAFGRLATEGPPDPAAWFNRALGLAWLGENRDAIACLDRSVSLEADSAFDQAVEAWTLAEVLRQGEGAESLSDDLRFACILDWALPDTAWLLAEFPEIRRAATPQAPGWEPETDPELELFEWLDRSGPVADPLEPNRPARAGDVARVLASGYICRKTGVLRLSSPHVETLQQVEDLLLPRLGIGIEVGPGPGAEAGPRSIRRVASPLPLPFQDAEVWTIRLPGGAQVEPDRADQLLRAWVEHSYEDEWIHRARQGLGGLSPLAAAQEVHRGDRVLRAKLAAVVGFREQLASRPSAVRLYQGYPFDRLRRRLGLEPADPEAVDPEDLTCAGPEELDRLDSLALDDHRLVEAVASAAGLRDDARTARLAAELLRRRPPSRPIDSLDLPAAVAPLVRRAIQADDFDAALRWIDQARPWGDPHTLATLDVWRAEIPARAGRPDEALGVYRGLIRADAAGAALALDGAETLLDNGHRDHARALLIAAGDLAQSTGRAWIQRRAQALLDRL